MQVTIELPDDVAERLIEKVTDLPRYTLEAFAIEGYRTESLSHGEVGRILGLSRWEVDALLKEAKAYLHYDMADLEQDIETLKRLEKSSQLA